MWPWHGSGCMNGIEGLCTARDASSARRGEKPVSVDGVPNAIVSGKKPRGVTPRLPRALEASEAEAEIVGLSRTMTKATPVHPGVREPPQHRSAESSRVLGAPTELVVAQNFSPRQQTGQVLPCASTSGESVRLQRPVVLARPESISGSRGPSAQGGVRPGLCSLGSLADPSGPSRVRGWSAHHGSMKTAVKLAGDPRVSSSSVLVSRTDTLTFLSTLPHLGQMPFARKQKLASVLTSWRRAAVVAGQQFRRESRHARGVWISRVFRAWCSLAAVRQVEEESVAETLAVFRRLRQERFVVQHMQRLRIAAVVHRKKNAACRHRSSRHLVPLAPTEPYSEVGTTFSICTCAPSPQQSILRSPV